jgi:hypothetical protein
MNNIKLDRYIMKGKRNFTKFCTRYKNLACPCIVIYGCGKKTQMPKGERVGLQLKITLL